SARHGRRCGAGTLQPCLQCAAAIRLGPIRTVRFAGPDRYWDGCHDFGKLSAREARKTQPARTGPRRHELGTFATLISRFGPTLPPRLRRGVADPGGRADGRARAGGCPEKWRRHRWPAITSHGQSFASHWPNWLAAGGRRGLALSCLQKEARCRGWSGSCWWSSASWPWSWASSTWWSPSTHCPRSSPATRPTSRATITFADTSPSLWAPSC